MFGVIFLFLAIYLLAKNGSLKNENEELKRELENIVNYCPECGCDLYNRKKSTNEDIIINDNDLYDESPSIVYNDNLPSDNYKEIIITKQERKPKYTEKEIKNSLILIVGSILIILSAILFLTSTWSITHNVFKTFIIILMLIIFLTASYIADKILNLKQTSKAFYYIALAYIPIISLSISIFELFGEYLSINGSGRYIYFTISSLIITIIYYYNAAKKKGRIIGIASIIFSILTILFAINIITNNISIILLFLIIYTLALSYLYNNNKIYLSNNLHIKTVHVLTASIIILTIYNNFINIIENNVYIPDIILAITLLYLIYYILNKMINKPRIFQNIYAISIIAIAFNASFIFDLFIIKQLLIFMSFAIIYCYDLLKNQKINILSLIEIIFIGIILCAETIINTYISSEIFIPSYIILSIISILSLIAYYYEDEFKKIVGYIFSTLITILSLNIIIHFNLSITLLGYIGLLLIIISLILPTKMILKEPLLNIGNITLILNTFMNYENNFLIMLLYLFYATINFLLHFKDKNNKYKIIGYIYSNLVLIFLLRTIDITEFERILIIPITTIALSVIEYYIKELKDTTNERYILFQFILSFIILNNIETSIIGIIILIMVNIVFIWYKRNHNLDNKCLFIPYIFNIPYIYIRLPEFLSNYYLNIMNIISITIIILLSYQIKNKKDNQYIIVSAIYLFCHICFFKESNYISLALISMLTYICYLIKNNKTKDIFKGLLYTYVIILINFITSDLSLNNITILTYGPILIWIPLITRTIIKKYDSSYKGWEYAGYIIINFLALANYSSEFDGIIFVFLLTIIVIGSYTYKIGPVFLVSLISILVNVLFLTRDFWLGIPWWLYILLIGSILVGFAIYNEVNNNKEKTRILDNIKDKLDL